jgi:demethylspheroidene O-methyltransferase
VIVAEPFAGARGAEVVGDVYFGFYLWAMGRGRARCEEELRALLRAAGFVRVRTHATRYAVQCGVIAGSVPA